MIELQKAIERSELTDDEIARALRVSRPTVSRWRIGRSAPHKLVTPKIVNDLYEIRAFKSYLSCIEKYGYDKMLKKRFWRIYTGLEN